MFSLACDKDFVFLIDIAMHKAMQIQPYSKMRKSKSHIKYTLNLCNDNQFAPLLPFAMALSTMFVLRADNPCPEPLLFGTWPAFRSAEKSQICYYRYSKWTELAMQYQHFVSVFAESGRTRWCLEDAVTHDDDDGWSVLPTVRALNNCDSVKQKISNHKNRNSKIQTVAPPGYKFYF